MSHTVSALERARAGYRPRCPEILQRPIGALALLDVPSRGAAADEDHVRARFPRSFGRPALRIVEGSGTADPRSLNVGVVLSGGQAPGGHNVISGLFDGLHAIHADSRLYGFRHGPRGIFTADYAELDAATVDPFRNTGGFDLIGAGRDKIETDAQLANCLATCRTLALDGLVVVGGDDSNTNAAVLAEYFLAQGASTAVVGVPKTIDGDLKGSGVEASFGFDTATKVYSELIGNICRDAKSAGKYWHFIKLMGRSASHVTLECALQTQVNLALIGEEERRLGRTLDEIVERAARLVRRRAEAGRQFGVCLVPEGLIEFIPEMRTLIDELNRLLADGDADSVERRLSERSAAVFAGLPDAIRRQLLLDRDSHGNVQVSLIETESLLTELVARRLDGAFRVQRHFFGYEGRCAAPSNFDADYTYGLGRVAAVLIAHGRGGYMCRLADLASGPDRWEAGAIPLTSMMQIEQRKGAPTPVIAKALVRLDGGPFRAFAAAREGWELSDDYVHPGALQYFGPPEVCDRPTRTLQLERGEP